MALKRKEWVMIAGTAMVIAATAVSYWRLVSKERQWEAMKEVTDVELARSMVVERVIEPHGAGGPVSQRFERGFVVCGTSWGQWSVYICEPGQLTMMESDGGSGWYAWRRSLTQAQWQELLGLAKACGPELGKAYVNRGITDRTTSALFDSPEAAGNPSILTYAAKRPGFNGLCAKVYAMAEIKEPGMERMKVDSAMERVIKEIWIVQAMSAMYQSGRESMDLVIPAG